MQHGKGNETSEGGICGSPYKKVAAIAITTIAIVAAILFVPFGGVLAKADEATGEFEDQTLEEARGENPTYLSILDGAQREGYLACKSIMETGKVGVKGDMSSEGRALIDASTESLSSLECVAYAGYDDPMLTAYSTGSAAGRKIMMDKGTGSIRIETAATVESDDLSRAYDEIEQAIRPIVSSALEQSEGSAESYVRAVAAKVAEGVSYNYDDSDSAHCNDVYGALVLGKSCCLGYASEVKLALDAVGLPNFIAYGNRAGQEHAWNMVQISGKWLLADTTGMSAYLQASGARDVASMPYPRRLCLRDMDALNAELAPSKRYEMSEASARLLNATAN